MVQMDVEIVTKYFDSAWAEISISIYRRKPQFSLRFPLI